MRVRKRKGVAEFLAAHSDKVITAPADWTVVFGNQKPLQIEVGCGKGDFILGMAAKYPEVNFVGIDLQETVISWALDKLLEAPLPNVRFLLTNGAALTAYFAAHSVSQMYLNFSDPWPKTRHAKRRLTADSFLAIYKELLSVDGALTFKTDNQGLFEWSLSNMSQYGMTLDSVSLDLHRNPELMENNVETEYERKFSRKGQPIFRLAARFEAGDVRA
ncbi:MAG: tRNA (guanosine(46)-N7)-methyltransferase TrmB [Streptococcaceae bacterium]|jgi:tRNA (guanine-N7-)-methyltransferase|nr:tRNA (guanosine(46)-N7)-methyltransferase TrmB [Streptococcaceae bacterium]